MTTWLVSRLVSRLRRAAAGWPARLGADLACAAEGDPGLVVLTAFLATCGPDLAAAFILWATAQLSGRTAASAAASCVGLAAVVLACWLARRSQLT